MGEMIEFPSNGTKGQGYLARPGSGHGPGVVVIQEWWGLNDQIKEVCDRFAVQGFVALAPDLYRGVVTKEPDEAAKLMMALNMDQAAKDMVGAVDELVRRPEADGRGVGVIGFCMGGGLALILATMRPEAVKACMPFYGVIPWPAHQPDYAKLGAAVQGHYAENDDSASPEMVHALEGRLRELGKEVEMHIHPGTDHAFTNHHRPEVFNPEETDKAMTAAAQFFHSHLDT